MSEETLFSQAIQIGDAAERQAFLNRVCSGNTDLRQELEQLLAAHFADSPLDRTSPSETQAFSDPDATARRADSPDMLTGTIIAGKYKLLERIGEGGMGDVWVADQLEPIKRRVALKLIKPGMDSRSVLGRFEAERQALAVMDHPNIAKVLDAGTTADNRPYFVMELVKGTPITEFCDARKLTPKQRLELFVPICLAIQHAHMKGIIHRDIKPTNVLVALHDETPVPKVIDFGVAKAVGQQLTEKTIYTGFGALVGTPAYMAPEQATFNQLDVDTRADVYALGVLLYELLAGSTPIHSERMKKAALDEVLRIVRDEEPERPSQRLSTSQSKASIAATRQSDPLKLSQLIKGELDWIVMKALEKDRTRRYETANGFAADIQRYLAGEPVQAVPPSVGYRIRKAYRRNRPAVLVAGVIAAMLTVGVITSLLFALRARDAERIARVAAVEAQIQATRSTELATVAGQATEAAQAERDSAKRAKDELRGSLYVNTMTLIPLASKAEQFGRVAELLDQQRPKPGETDLRGFEWHYWDREVRGEERSIELPRPINPFQVSGDGRVAAYVKLSERKLGERDYQGRLEIKDLVTGTVLNSWAIPVHYFATLSMSHDGRRVAMTLSHAGPSAFRARLLVWNVADGRVLLDQTGQYTLNSTTRAAISPDGSAVAAVEGNLPGLIFTSPKPNVVTVWDLNDPQGKPKTFPLGHSQTDFASLTFRRDGKRLAVCFADTLFRYSVKDQETKIPNASVHVLNAETGRFAEALDIPTRTVSLSFAADGSSLSALVDSPHRIIHWAERDDGTFRERLSTPFESNTAPGTFPPRYVLTPGPDGRTLAVHSAQSATTWLLDAETGARRHAVKSPGGVRLVRFTGAGEKLLVVSNLETKENAGYVVREWALPNSVPRSENGDVEIPGPNGHRRVRYHPGSGDLRLADRDGRVIRALHITPAPKVTGIENNVRVDEFGYVRARIEFSPNGRHFVAIPTNGPTKVFDAETGDEKWAGSGFTGFGSRAFSKSVELSSDRRVILLPEKGQYRVLNFGDFSPRHSISTTATKAYLSADGTRCVTVSRRVVNLDNETVEETEIWNLANGQKIGSIPLGPFVVRFSPDGRRFATFSSPDVTIWDTETGRKLSSFAGGSNLGGGEFNADGTAILVWQQSPVTNLNSLPVIRDVATGAIRFRLDGFAGVMNAAAFSPDGLRIATASEAGTDVRLWDAATGREMIALTGAMMGRAGVIRLTFSPEGHRLTMSNAALGKTVTWNATPRQTGTK